MAERIGDRITRGELKQVLGSSVRFYDFLVHQTDEIFRIEDDFAGPVLSTFLWTVGNGGGASALSPAVSVGLVNGALTAVTGTAGDGTADSFISSGRHFRGDQNAIMKARVKVGAAVASTKIEIGFGDAIASAATHVVNSKSGNTFIATDGVCWIYDTSDSGRGWDGMGVAATVAATRMTSYNTIPVADTYESLQVALIDGVAFFTHFDLDGKRDFGPVAMAAAVTKTTLLAAYVSVEARSATSKTLTIDKVKAWQARTSTP